MHMIKPTMKSPNLPKDTRISGILIGFQKHNLYQLEEVFEVVGLHPPTRGDGPRSRHDEFMTTELLGYFDELFTDDKYISNLKLNEEEEFFACLDRGVSDLSDYFDAKTLASRYIPEA